MVANILPTHTLNPVGGVKRSNYIFLWKYNHVAYQIKGNWAQSTMKANMLYLHTPTTPGVGSECHIIFFFSKSGHVAYQIKVEEV